MSPVNQSSLGIYRATAENLKIKQLLYGNPGAGKTTLALTANDHPALAPALVLNFEGGLLSVTARGDVDVIDLKTIDDLENVFWHFQQGSPDVQQYNTIVVDSGSEIYNKALRESVQDNILKNNKRGNDVDDIHIEDYGKATAMIVRIFSMFRDLPCHLVVTSHAKFTYPPNSDKNPNAQPTEVRPAFSASLATRLEGIFDFVHYLYTYEQARSISEGESVVDTHRGLITRTTGPYHAKTRGPYFAEALGPLVSDPNLPMLYDLLLATEGQPQQPPEPVQDIWDAASASLFPPDVDTSTLPDAAYEQPTKLQEALT